MPRERFERWPRLPCLRSETHYEELSFALSLAWSRRYRPSQFDAVVGCTYPFLNWFLRGAGRRGGPLQIFVTQNGDWPCHTLNREYRYFRCDGLICTNPAYFAAHRDRYRATLIPNGVDPLIFHPPTGDGDAFHDPRLPTASPIVLMASAFSPSKRVLDGVRVVARVPGAFLLMVGDGQQRGAVVELARQFLPGRHLLLGSVPRESMPGIYRRADALLHMSQDEPFGIVYLEGASTGLAVVAHDGPVPRWILGDTALFANTSDLEAVGDALRRATQPDVKASLGRAARERMQASWTWQAQATHYRAFMLQLSTARGAAPVPRRSLAAGVAAAAML